MNTLGSHPGAISFRLSIMVILILIFILYFLFYFDDYKQDIESSSILQTKKIIDSSLAVVFATHAVNGDLDGLNEIEGGNPFEFLKQYQMLPTTYQGVLEQEPPEGLPPGWYYVVQNEHVVYVPRYLADKSYYAITLKYRDHNQSGRFESAADKFQNLLFQKKTQR